MPQGEYAQAMPAVSGVVGKIEALDSRLVAALGSLSQALDPVLSPVYDDANCVPVDPATCTLDAQVSRLNDRVSDLYRIIDRIAL